MKRLVVAVTFVALTAVAPASADTISYLGHSPYGLDGFYIQYPAGTYPVARWAGERALTGVGGTGDIWYAYCLDVFTPAKSTPHDMTVRPITDLATGVGSSPDYAQPGSGDRVGQIFSLYSGLATDSLHAAALQLAIWEVIFETGAGFDLGGGAFRMVAAVTDPDLVIKNQALDLATLWAQSLAANPGVVPSGLWLDGVSQGDGRSQDFGVPVPEPASLVLLGSGLLAAGAAARRRRRRA